MLFRPPRCDHEPSALHLAQVSCPGHAAQSSSSPLQSTSRSHRCPRGGTVPRLEITTGSLSASQLFSSAGQGAGQRSLCPLGAGSRCEQGVLGAVGSWPPGSKSPKLVTTPIYHSPEPHRIHTALPAAGSEPNPSPGCVSGRTQLCLPASIPLMPAERRREEGEDTAVESCGPGMETT